MHDLRRVEIIVCHIGINKFGPYHKSEQTCYRCNDNNRRQYFFNSCGFLAFVLSTLFAFALFHFFTSASDLDGFFFCCATAMTFVMGVVSVTLGTNPKGFLITGIFFNKLLRFPYITVALNKNVYRKFTIAISNINEFIYFIFGSIFIAERLALYFAGSFSILCIGNFFPNYFSNIFMERKVSRIHCLKVAKLPGHMVWVHFKICRNQCLFKTLIHKNQISAPLVFYPSCIKMVTL